MNGKKEKNSIKQNVDSKRNKDQKKDIGFDKSKPVSKIKTPDEFVDLGGDALMSQSEILDFSEGTDSY